MTISLLSCELLDVHADRCADDRAPAGLAGRRADRAVEQRRAEPVEEPAIHRRRLQQAHRSRVAVRHDRLRPIGRLRDAREPFRDRRKRFVPGNPREAAFALLADPLHRMQQALAGIGTIEVAGNLGAQHARRGRMIRRAADFDGAAVLDRGQQRARVRAVVRTRAANDMPAGGQRRVKGHGRDGDVELKSTTSHSTGLRQTGCRGPKRHHEYGCRRHSAGSACRRDAGSRARPRHLEDGRAVRQRRARGRGAGAWD